MIQTLFFILIFSLSFDVSSKEVLDENWFKENHKLVNYSIDSQHFKLEIPYNHRFLIASSNYEVLSFKPEIGIGSNILVEWKNLKNGKIYRQTKLIFPFIELKNYDFELSVFYKNKKLFTEKILMHKDRDTCRTTAKSCVIVKNGFGYAFEPGKPLKVGTNDPVFRFNKPGKKMYSLKVKVDGKDVTDKITLHDNYVELPESLVSEGSKIDLFGFGKNKKTSKYMTLGGVTKPVYLLNNQLTLKSNVPIKRVRIENIEIPFNLEQSPYSNTVVFNKLPRGTYKTEFISDCCIFRGHLKVDKNTNSFEFVGKDGVFQIADI